MQLILEDSGREKMPRRDGRGYRSFETAVTYCRTWLGRLSRPSQKAPTCGRLYTNVHSPQNQMLGLVLQCDFEVCFFLFT